MYRSFSFLFSVLVTLLLPLSATAGDTHLDGRASLATSSPAWDVPRLEPSGHLFLYNLGESNMDLELALGITVPFSTQYEPVGPTNLIRLAFMDHMGVSNWLRMYRFDAHGDEWFYEGEALVNGRFNDHRSYLGLGICYWSEPVEDAPTVYTRAFCLGGHAEWRMLFFDATMGIELSDRAYGANSFGEKIYADFAVGFSIRGMVEAFQNH